MFGLIGVVGMGIMIWGMWEIVVPPPVKVEIIEQGKSSEHLDASLPAGRQGSELEGANRIIVDVGGGVEKPGVYSLSSGSRIGDALVMAGGLAAQADRAWIAQTMNLAKEIKDGEKIYIPMISDNNLPNKPILPNMPNSTNLININTASIGELDKLEGIGEVRAQAIVANRPYAQVEELMSKAKISESVYEKIKDLVAVY